MTFEADGMKVTQPLDPYQGPRYIDPTEENMKPNVLDTLYTLNTGKRADHIKPTADGSVSWQSIHSVSEDLEETFKKWKQGRYENISRCFATIVATRWIGTEIK